MGKRIVRFIVSISIVACFFISCSDQKARESIQALSVKFELSEEAYNIDKDAINSEVAGLKKSIDSIVSSVDGIKSEITKLNKSDISQNEKIASLTKKLSSLTAKLTKEAEKLTAKLTEVESKIGTQDIFSAEVVLSLKDEIILIKDGISKLDINKANATDINDINARVVFLESYDVRALLLRIDSLEQFKENFSDVDIANNFVKELAIVKESIVIIIDLKEQILKLQTDVDEINKTTSPPIIEQSVVEVIVEPVIEPIVETVIETTEIEMIQEVQ